jgi:hypothetical protein
MEILYHCWIGVVLTHMGMSPNHGWDREKCKGIVRSKKKIVGRIPLLSNIKYVDVEYRYKFKILVHGFISKTID